MNYFRIENKGEVDINAFTLLGASSKEGDDSKIGFFGSGNKYALALLLREGYDVKIFSGTYEVEVGIKEISFRNETFSRIMIDGKETSLTTRTGPNWELWMAMREFICNAIDEGGESFTEEDEIPCGIAGTTRIYVSFTAELEEIVENITNIVVTDVEPITRTPYGNILKGLPKNTIYRKGIRVTPWVDNMAALFSYDIKYVDINESRVVTSPYSVSCEIHKMLAYTDNIRIITEVVESYRSNPSYTWESYASGWNVSNFSSTWRDVLFAYGKTFIACEIVSAYPDDIVSNYIALPSALLRALKEQWSDLPVHGDLTATRSEAIPSKELKREISLARRSLSKLGIKAKMSIKYCNFVDKNTVARVEDPVGMETVHTMYISVDATAPDGWESVLLEEIVHINTGFGDHSRSLQTYLFNELLKAKKTIAKLKELV